MVISILAPSGAKTSSPNFKSGCEAGVICLWMNVAELIPGRRPIMAAERQSFAAGKSRLEIVFESSPDSTRGRFFLCNQAR
jgi:hypothetical protein